MNSIVTRGVLTLFLCGAAAMAPSTRTSAADKAAEAVVHIANFAFKPPTLKIHTGQAVLFVNDDDEAHTITSTSKSFDSGGLDTHESWHHTFTKPGTYQYFCALHPYMKAVVVVSDNTTK